MTFERDGWLASKSRIFLLDGAIELSFNVTLVAKRQILAGYEYLRNMPKEAWVWEYLRRNKTYAEAFQNHQKSIKKGKSSSKIYSQKEMEAAAKFGLLFFR